MIERTDKRFGLKPKHLAADTAYGTGKFLGWLIGAGMEIFTATGIARVIC
jgi:hypothetical protein